MVPVEEVEETKTEWEKISEIQFAKPQPKCIAGSAYLAQLSILLTELKDLPVKVASFSRAFLYNGKFIQTRSTNLGHITYFIASALFGDQF